MKGEKYRLLVVDDEPDLLHLVKLTLEATGGFEVLTADGGAAGLRTAEAELPDIILLDLMMPDLDGLEVCRLLKGNSETSKIPIVMLTAKTRIQDAVAAFQFGASNYILKPFDPEHLHRQLLATLEQTYTNAPV